LKWTIQQHKQILISQTLNENTHFSYKTNPTSLYYRTDKNEVYVAQITINNHMTSSMYIKRHLRALWNVKIPTNWKWFYKFYCCCEKSNVIMMFLHNKKITKSFPFHDYLSRLVGTSTSWLSLDELKNLPKQFKTHIIFCNKIKTHSLTNNEINLFKINLDFCLMVSWLNQVPTKITVVIILDWLEIMCLAHPCYTTRFLAPMKIFLPVNK